MHRNWIVSRTNQEFVHYLSNTVSISPLFAQVLINRGMKDAESIRDFLSPSLENISDPFLMPDMKKAVDRLKQAIDRNERVFILGDYDADGLTATALLISALGRLGLKTNYHIPNRMTEGYGISSRGIQKAGEWNADLIITADCGISARTELAVAMSMGMDVIVTDHHEPPEKLPRAAAVVDPHRSDSVYPFKFLAGVGVAFKVIQALVQDMERDDIEAGELLDLVALGTIADSVPLVGENRIFVSYGMRRINDVPARTGIQALKDVSGVSGNGRAGSLSYSLIPRINAAGRLDDAAEVVELFLTEDQDRAKGIAKLLEEQNRKRRKIEADVLKTALDMIRPDEMESAIVLSSPDWHPGVIGIVASRLVDMFYRPVFLFSEKDSFAKGSARSIPPFHLYKAIAGCSELLLGYGGHRQAAGLRIECDKLPAFTEKMNRIVRENLSAEDMVPMLDIDAAVKFSDLNFTLIDELALLEPFGESNKQPVFGTKNIEIINRKVVGNNHLKMMLRQESINIDTIGFSMGSQFDKIGFPSRLDIAFIPTINEWNGTKNLQLTLKALRPRT